jgi:adenylylsulfate kinase
MKQEFKLNQNGFVIWLYGLSGAGKTTISTLLKEKLSLSGYFSIILDGDNLRSGINKDLMFTLDDRLENIRRVAEIAKLLAQNNVITICSLITPLKDYRALAKGILKGQYFEVYIDCPLEVCEKRDVKGLYKLSREKKIKNFTGIDSAFEPSYNSDLVISTVDTTPQQATQTLYDSVITRLAQL